MAFYPLLLQWEYRLTIRLKDITSKIAPDFVKFIENRQDISWEYYFLNEATNPKIYLQITMKRRILPIDKKYILRLIEVPIIISDASYSLEMLSKNKSYSKYFIKGSNIETQLPKMLQLLHNSDFQEYYVRVSFRSIKLQNPREMKNYINSNNFQGFGNSVGNYISNTSDRISPKYYGTNFESDLNKLLRLIYFTSKPEDGNLLAFTNSEMERIDYKKEKTDSIYLKKLMKILRSNHLKPVIFRCQLEIGVTQNYMGDEIEGYFNGIFGEKARKRAVFFDTSRIGLWRLINAFNADTLIKQSPSTIELNENSSNTFVIGKIVNHHGHLRNFLVTPEDFFEGGMITGGIGTGKTTLRLAIMKFLSLRNFRIIDFDLKGDACKEVGLQEISKILVPGRNFRINPFEKPPGFTNIEFTDVLMRIFTESQINNQLTPPQSSLLFESIRKTVEDKGNGYSFFTNILKLSNNSKKILDNNQETTAQALINRFSWMQDNLDSIFWYNESTLSEEDYLTSNLLFDFSYISHLATHNQIRMIVDIVTTYLQSSFRNIESIERRTVIFIDEGQIILPRNHLSQMTRLEETISTLRYKGISIIATGISSKHMSEILHETNFIAQFRSDSRELITKLGVDESRVSTLPAYHAIMRSKKMGMKGMEVIIHNPQLHIVNKITVEQKHDNKIARFTLDFSMIWDIHISSIIDKYVKIHITVRHLLKDDVKFFLKYFLLENRDPTIIELDGLVLYNKYLQAREWGVLSVNCLENPHEFIALLVREYYLRIIELVKNQPTFHILSRRYEEIISKSLNPFFSRNSLELPIDLDESKTRFEVLHARLKKKFILPTESLQEFVKLMKIRYIEFFNSEISNLSRKVNIDIHTLIEVTRDLNIISQEMYLDLHSFFFRDPFELIQHKDNLIRLANKLISLYKKTNYLEPKMV